MIFGGHVQYLRCASCGQESRSTTPTSILPMLAVVVLGAFQWIDVISLFRWHKAIVVALAILLGILFPFALMLLEGAWHQWRLRRCPQCGSEFKVIGGGFYDGCLPLPGETVIYVVSLLVPFLIKRFV